MRSFCSIRDWPRVLSMLRQECGRRQIQGGSFDIQLSAQHDASTREGWFLMLNFALLLLGCCQFFVILKRCCGIFPRVRCVFLQAQRCWPLDSRPTLQPVRVHVLQRTSSFVEPTRGQHQAQLRAYKVVLPAASPTWAVCLAARVQMIRKRSPGKPPCKEHGNLAGLD